MQTNVVSIFIVIVVVLIILALLHWLFGWKEHKQYYFVADEVVFEITHPTGTPPAAIRNALQGFLNPKGNDSQQASVGNTQRANRNWRKRLQSPTLLTDSRIITFPSLNDQSVSLVPIPLVPFSLNRLNGHRKRDLRPNDVISVLNGAYAELQNIPREVGTDIRLISFSPNWLTSDLHHGAATGGPGSWPLSVTHPGLNQQMIHLVQGPSAATSGKKVKVAVLDTAPVSAEDETRIRALIPTLAPVSYENISPGNSQSLNGLRPYTPPSEHIQMPDHGTFVASIIHSAAQNAATIHLYEVLNNYGVGTFTIVAQGLDKAIKDLDDGSTPFIINCSFMFRVPPGEDLLADLDVPISNLIGSIRNVFETKTQTKPYITIVAAAGNDNDGSLPKRPEACYPAAFKNVVSVGALPSENYPPDPQNAQRYKVASYSNSSYSQHEGKLPDEGYMTYGGELDNPPGAMSGDPISSNGVLGVYLGPIAKRGPSGTIVISSPKNPTEWARWAGTSFAAPIITGLLAMGFALPRPSQYRTVDGENVIKVKQP